MLPILLLVETCPFMPIAPSSPIAQVIVVADSASLAVGSEAGVTATLHDANGTILNDRSVTWSVNDTAVATVLASGPTSALLTARAAGPATITALAEGTSGGAEISVSDATGGTGSDTTSSGGQNAHEPAGYAAITSRPFALKVEDGWTATTSAGFSIISDLSAPLSVSTVGQMRYPAGASEYDPGWTERSIANLGYREVYVSCWVKLSSNWQGHDSFVNKIGFFWIDGGPDVVFIAVGKDSGPLSTQVRTQGTPQGERNLSANLSNLEVVRGRWHHWEIVLKVNTGDSADGEVHWWIDGVKAGEYRDVAFTSSAQGKNWETLSWRPIWGGRGDTVIEDMYMWMDHFYASGR